MLSTGCCAGKPYLTLPKPPMPEAPVLHSQPTPPPPPADAKGVWFPLADAGALRKYIEELIGTVQECNVVIDRGKDSLGER